MPWPRTALLLLAGVLPVFSGQEREEESVDSTGNVALIDLGTETYRGFEGGLYPGGANAPPAAHLEAALERAAAITPLDPAGAPDPGRGLIVLLSVGLSNAAHEFAEFEREQDENPLRNPRIVLVNGGQAGQSTDAIADSGAWYWRLVRDRLSALELSPAQVQVVWLRQNRSPAFHAAKARMRGEKRPAGGRGEKAFPETARELQGELERIVRILREQFPNLRLCYLSDRTFHGHKGLEPTAYEAGFAIKWLIEDQIGGKAALDWRAGRAPLLLWGPYLWADGVNPNGQGTRWLREDFETVRVEHPSRAGEEKVARLLGDFFARDPTAAPWFPNHGTASQVCRDAVADAHVDSKRPDQSFGASPVLSTSDFKGRQVAYLRFDLSDVRRPVLHAKLSLRNGEADDPGDPRAVFLVSEDGWEEASLTFAGAPELGPALGLIPEASRDGTRSLAVTAAVNGEADATLTLAVTATPEGQPSEFLARESGSPPRLVLIEAPDAE